MSQESLITTGIALRTIDVKDNDRISIVFTRDYGLIKVYLYKAKSRNHQAAIAATPLVEAEWVIQTGKDELFLFKEVSIASQNLHLRHDFHVLQAACDMLKSSEKALMEGDPAPKLYDLLRTLLERLSEAVSPPTVKALYQLKFLLHQGLLGEDDPSALVELARIRSLQVFLGAELTDDLVLLIQGLFEERF